MPELPEVETVCRALSPVLEGAILQDVVIRQFALRFPVPSNFHEKLVSRRIVGVQRRAKYLLITLEDGGVIIGHLGMSGRMTIYRAGDNVPLPGPHDHIDFKVRGGDLVRFSDPRRFGLMTLTEVGILDEHTLIKNLGPEPLNPDFTGAALADRLKGCKSSIKSALLDQRKIAGLGNIYACESLFRSGISPKRRAKNVQGVRAIKLMKAVESVLIEALEAGGSSIQDHIQPNGKLGYFQKCFQVYGREGEACPTCNCDWLITGGIKRITQAGRSTFYCSRKQT